LIQGDKAKEKQLRATAMQTPPHDANELFYISRDRLWGSAADFRGYPKYSFEDQYKDHREMLRLDHNYYNAMFFIGYRLEGEHRYAEALVAWYACASMNPDDSTAIFNRAETHIRLGQFEEGKADLERVLSARPNSPVALYDVAFILSTNPNETIRQGKRALELAQKACELTDFKEYRALDALAAANAEVGDFNAAVKFSETAIKLIADNSRRGDLVKHLESFRQNKPWREE
jgi:tetratricopeptide (TPR) repeat protein